MWPRTETAGLLGSGPVGDMNAARRAKPGGLSGFVSYMRRKDAEAALRELDGFSWGGSLLRVGWSKSVTLPARPLYGECFVLKGYRLSD
jgi:U2-associated protein SR140